MSSIVGFDFKKYFTSDSSDLISNYIINLENYMTREGVYTEQINVVINGILEFIGEYATNYKDEKINFSATLGLIEEIGSPTEIVQSLDFKKTNLVSESIICQYCKMTNAIDNIYCEFCGKSIKKILKSNEQDNQTEYYPYKNFIPTRKQDIIDHPYSRSYLLFTAIFTLLFIFLSYTSDFWKITGHVDGLLFFVGSFLFSLVVALIISLFFSIVFGLIMDIIYKDFKSAKFQYDKIIEHFEENLVAGFMMVFFGITILTLTTFYKSELIPFTAFFWIAVMIINYLYLIFYGRQSFRPKTLSLTQLNLLKFNIEKKNRDKYYKFNKTVILPIILLSIITSLILNPAITLTPLLLSVMIFSLLYLAILNGFLIMQINSWKIILENPIK